jgi:hypothetical protein
MSMHTKPTGWWARLRLLRAVAVSYFAFMVGMLVLSPAGPIEAVLAIAIAVAVGLLVARQGRSRS